MTAATTSQETNTTYRDPLTCAECGCFLSEHDVQCSKWQEVTVRS